MRNIEIETVTIICGNPGVPHQVELRFITMDDGYKLYKLFTFCENSNECALCNFCKEHINQLQLDNLIDPSIPVRIAEHP